MIALTERQQAVLDYIRAFTAARGFPPTVREIGCHFGIRSTNGVMDHLMVLTRKGHIARVGLKSRGIRLTEPVKPPIQAVVVDGPTVKIPVVKQIHAGQPLVAESEVVHTYAMHPDDLPGPGTFFGIRIQSPALTDDGILPGDDIIFRVTRTMPRERALCAVMVGEAAVVRRVVTKPPYVALLGNQADPPLLVRADSFTPTMVLGQAVRLWRSITPKMEDPHVR